MIVPRNEGVQLMNVTRSPAIRFQNNPDEARIASLNGEIAPPPIKGNSVCSIDASKEQEMRAAERKLASTWNSAPSAVILLARLACETTTPFGVPVDPEV